MTKTNNNSKKFLKKYHDILLCLLLLMVTLSVYWQVQDYDFVNFDDPKYVIENSYVQEDMTLKSIIWAFTTVHMGSWHPLTWLSHMLDYQFYGMKPGWHHLTNLFFHILSTILLFFVLKKMTGSFWKSGFVAALFALHPLHVESVAWVSERKDVLSTFFWMLTMLGYIWYVEHPAVNRYLLVVVLFTLGLISKPMLVTLPFVLLLLDFWPLYRFRFHQPESSGNSKQRSILFRLIWEKVPLFILVAIISALTFYAQKQGGAIASFDFIPLKVRIANALVSYVKYIGKMIYPSNLAVFYPHPGMLPWWKITGACLLLVSISFLAIKVIKQSPYFAVGWLWYLGTLVPVIGLVQVGTQSIADRYTYIPLIGLFIIIAWGIPELFVRWRHLRIEATILVTVLLLILMAVTWKQLGYWKDSVTLFDHTLKVTSKNWLSHNNLGTALNKKGRTEEAIHHYLEALHIKPNFEEAHYNLGNALNKQGRTEEAIHHYLEAVSTEPDYEEAHYNLGLLLNKEGRTEEAIHHYLEALRIKPDFEKAHNNLGNALDKQGRTEEAIHHYLEALRIKPDFKEAYNNMGVALFGKGDIEGAIACFQDALRIKPDYVQAKNNLKNVLMIQQQKQ
jgi:tetratricopeptide (TPR) repeat protein